MANGTKEAVEEGLRYLSEILKEVKPASTEARVITRELREIRVLANTARIAEAQRRYHNVLTYLSELRPEAALAAEALASRVPSAIEAAAPVARPVAPLVIDRPWFRDTDSFGPVLVSQIRIFGIPIHRIVRAGERVYFARMRAVVPEEVAALLGDKRKIGLSLAEKKGVGWDMGLSEADAVTQAERMTARSVRSGKAPALEFKGANAVGKVVPQPGGKFGVEVRSAPGTPARPMSRSILDTYEQAIEFIRRALLGGKPAAASRAVPTGQPGKYKVGVPREVPIAVTPAEKRAAAELLSGREGVKLPVLSAAQQAEVHRLLTEASRIARTEEAAIQRTAGGAFGGPGSNLVVVEYGGKMYIVSRFGLPASLGGLLLALGISEADIYGE